MTYRIASSIRVDGATGTVCVSQPQDAANNAIPRGMTYVMRSSGTSNARGYVANQIVQFGDGTTMPFYSCNDDGSTALVAGNVIFMWAKVRVGA